MLRNSFCVKSIKKISELCYIRSDKSGSDYCGKPCVMHWINLNKFVIMLQPMHLQYKHFKFHENISFSARLRTLKASDY